MEGENFVQLQGKICWPELKIVGDGFKLFKAKIALPIEEYEDKFQYLKIASWGNTAEALDELPAGVFIKLQGHIEERSYNGKCRHCKAPEKKYWTEVVVDNFVVVDE